LVVSKPNSVDVINSTFRLHRFTAVILICCSILVSCKQFLGENIHCMLDGLEHGGTKKLIESFCFMKATFTLSRSQGAFHLDSHHGIGQGNHREDENNEFHNYYQWVCFMLFLQAIFFYFPYITWKNVEKGRMKKMLMKIPGTGEKADCAIVDAPLDEQVEGLAKYIFENKTSYSGYARWFLLCEVANLFNVFAQIYLMDRFLGGKFLDYGKSFFDETRENFYLNTESVFPKVAKCTMPIFGATGKVVYHSGICTLPINILNEKIYVFLFAWLVILSLVSVLHCITELCIIVFPILRKISMSSVMFEFGYGCRLTDPTMDKIMKNSSYGLFVILRQMSKNMEPPQFKALLTSLGKYFKQGSNLPTSFPSSSNCLENSKLPSSSIPNPIFRV